MQSTASSSPPHLSLNHVSFVCKSVADSVRFYQNVLGFVLIQRPSSFNFQGAWLFNYEIGVHLLAPDNLSRKIGGINPKDNHISFQCTDVNLVIRKLDEMGIEYVTAHVEEGGIIVDQLFFHDPDGYMIEICNCGNLPVLSIISDASCPLKSGAKSNRTTIDSSSSSSSSDHQLGPQNDLCGGLSEVRQLMSQVEAN